MKFWSRRWIRVIWAEESIEHTFITGKCTPKPAQGFVEKCSPIWERISCLDPNFVLPFGRILPFGRNSPKLSLRPYCLVESDHEIFIFRGWDARLWRGPCRTWSSCRGCQMPSPSNSPSRQVTLGWARASCLEQSWTIGTYHPQMFFAFQKKEEKKSSLKSLMWISQKASDCIECHWHCTSSTAWTISILMCGEDYRLVPAMYKQMAEVVRLLHYIDNFHT